MVTGADHDELIATYRRFYPLMQEAFAQLGYPDGYFNDRVIAVIDHLLATPEPEEPIRLVQPHVIRMGPDHAARIRDFLTELRTHIAQPPR
jgi:hypothetical protein